MLKPLFDLSGQIAVITGGSRGLGLAIAEALGEYGATPILIARKAHDLARAVDHLAGLGIRAHAVAADLGAADLGATSGIETLVAGIMAEHGRIDILVNNAGTSWAAPAQDQTARQWAKIIDLDMNAVFFMAQQVARQAMIPARAGRILNIASIAGLVGQPPAMVSMVGYSTAKGAVIQMTRALAAEWGGYGIAVNALAPGYFPTRLTAGLLDSHAAEITRLTPLGRLASVQDMAGPALLLCCQAGRHITGHVLVVDGGATVV